MSICSGSTDLYAGKPVTAIFGFAMDASQVFGHQSHGGRLLQKSQKLWVMGISDRLASQYGLGEQTLPPQGNQSAGVEVLRM